MRDFGAERPIRPIIQQDSIIDGMLEGGGVFYLEDRSGFARAGERFPVEALGAEIGCDGAVDCDDAFAP